jgi:TRAP-type C4-dicarboxylate transport system permease small subunit
MSDLPAGGRQLDPGRPRLPVRIEQACAAIALALITLITFANVVARYLTQYSFAFTEEFSVFLLVVMTLFGAGAAFAQDRHIRMSFITDRLPERAARRVESGVTLLGLLMFGLLVVYGARLTWDDWRYDTTSPGLGIPQWIYSLWLPLLSAAILLRLLGRLVRLWRARS